MISRSTPCLWALDRGQEVDILCKHVVLFWGHFNIKNRFISKSWSPTTISTPRNPLSPETSALLRSQIRTRSDESLSGFARGKRQVQLSSAVSSLRASTVDLEIKACMMKTICQLLWLLAILLLFPFLVIDSREKNHRHPRWDHIRASEFFPKKKQSHTIDEIRNGIACFLIFLFQFMNSNHPSPSDEKNMTMFWTENSCRPRRCEIPRNVEWIYPILKSILDSMLNSFCIACYATMFVWLWCLC